MNIEVQLSVSGGAYQAGGITAAATATIQPRLNPNTTSGVWTVLWEIYEYPPGAACPAGWTNDTAGARFHFTATASTALSPPVVALTGQPWGKWLLRATANSGVAGGAVDYAATRDEATAWSVESPTAIEDYGILEENQFSALGNGAAIKAFIRSVSDAILAPQLPLAETTVTANVAEGWETIATYAVASVLSADDTARTITLDMTVTDGTTAAKDSATMVAKLHRDDSGGHDITNLDDDASSATSVPWVFVLQEALRKDSACGELEAQFIFSTGDLLLQAKQHPTSARTVSGDVYFGTAR